MKKRRLLSAVTLAIGVTMQAADYGYLTFRQSDGTETSLVADGLKLTFSEGFLTATRASQTSTFSLSALSGMYFSTTGSAGIHTLQQQGGMVSVADGQVYVAAPAGAKVALYSLSGMQMACKTTVGSGAEAVGGRLQQGVYIVSVNGVKTKVFVR